MLKRLNHHSSRHAINSIKDHSADIVTGLGWTALAVDLCMVAPGAGFAISTWAGGAVALTARLVWQAQLRRRERRQASTLPQPSMAHAPTHNVRWRRNSFGAVGASLLGIGAAVGVDMVIGPKPVLAIKTRITALTTQPAFRPVYIPPHPLSEHDGIAVLPCIRNCGGKPAGPVAGQP